MTLNEEFTSKNLKYRIVPSSKFKKDYKLARKNGYDLDLLKDVVRNIALGKKLDPKYKDHGLAGNYKGCRECHITPDWLLIYEISQENLILYLTRTGSHSNLY